MAQKQELMASSLPAAAANKLGFDALTTFTAAGGSQGAATALTSNCANINAGTGGVILAANVEDKIGVNTSGGSITLYPPVGSAINGGSANAGITIPNGKSYVANVVGTNIIVTVSA